MVLHTLHICSGYGGFELGFKLAGIPTKTVCHIEREAYAAATLVARMEEEVLDLAPIWSEVETFDTKPWIGKVDAITAGFPCQPFSAAGRKKGLDDDRWLWPQIYRIISDLGPRVIFLENVTGLIKHGLPEVLKNLAEIGYDAEWGMLSAAEIGATHQRNRIWILGYPNIERFNEIWERENSNEEGVQWNPDRSSMSNRIISKSTTLGNSNSKGRSEKSRSIRGYEGEIWSSEGSNIISNSSSENIHDTIKQETTELANTESINERESDNTKCSITRDNTRGNSIRSINRIFKFPPARNDFDGWEEYIAKGGPEPAIRRSTNGPPEGLADALHLGGNGLVPQVAATAFIELANRAGIIKYII